MYTGRLEAALTVVVLLALTSVPACHRAVAPEPGRPMSWVSDMPLPAETFLVRDVVPRRATLDALLRNHGVDTDSIGRIVGAMAGVFDPRRLKSLQPFMIERTILGALRLFEYEIDADSFLRVAVDHASSELKAEVLPIPKTLETATASGAITPEASSLFAAMKAAGEADDLAIALAGVFSGEIDFNSEVQPEDSFAVVFERFHREGRPDTYGRILAAEFHNEGRVVRAINFARPGGEPAYYDAEGHSLRRFFLKSPLKFEPRVTSGFSMRRMHPVLHTSRAHRGVDYSAPHGAPVVAVASGTVMSASFDSTNGRMVRLKHPSGYQSYYLHLSGFASGIRAGAHVDQNDVIGFVGSTGLATGTHLHYGLTKNGTFVNPLVEHRNMPPGEPVDASEMAAFNEVKDQALRDLGGARDRALR
jgi:murein DD-endopeptidase MepM/ murein hydrolase activator NlpD